jgi:phage terminase Nu1 subunit (DNA packaging protein)
MAVKNNSKTVRRSLTLHRDIDAKVQKLARHQNWSANRVLENLVEAGLKAKEAEKQRFFELAERLRTSDDQAVVKQLKEELARMTFGE